MARLKLHLGCGQRFIPGFIHVDLVEADHIDLVTNVDDLSMIPDGQASLIYACHVLEHFKRRTLARVLREWWRVLEPGGTLRVAVPDFDVLCRLYVSGKATIDQVHGPIMGGQVGLFNFHYCIFDFASLGALLESVGYRDVRRYDWRKTEHAHIDDYSQAYLPHMDKENGTLISLNVEAIKEPNLIGDAAPEAKYK